MSGDPYVCPHGVMAAPICAECPPPTGWTRQFTIPSDLGVSASFSVGGNDLAIIRCAHSVDLRFQRCFMCQPDTGALSEGQAERLFATLDRIIRALDRIEAGRRREVMNHSDYLRDEAWSVWMAADTEAHVHDECPYCSGQMCARFDGLNCHHDAAERHGYPAPADQEALRKAARAHADAFWVYLNTEHGTPPSDHALASAMKTYDALRAALAERP